MFPFCCQRNCLDDRASEQSARSWRGTHPLESLLHHEVRRGLCEGENPRRKRHRAGHGERQTAAVVVEIIMCYLPQLPSEWRRRNNYAGQLCSHFAASGIAWTTAQVSSLRAAGAEHTHNHENPNPSSEPHPPDALELPFKDCPDTGLKRVIRALHERLR